MSAGPRLAVALPVRNGANFLAEALDSILAQDFADFELQVSDNASTDATPEILAGYAARDPRVRVSRSPEPLSQMDNMNRAVALTRSPWVKLFCHDDLMRGDCLRRLDAAITVLDGTGVGLIGNGERHLFGNGYMTPENESRTIDYVPGREAIARKLWNTRRPIAFPAVTTATVRRDAFDEAGGFDSRFVYFDTFCWLELLTSFDYAVLPASLTVNRIHPAQVAAQAQRTLRDVDDYRTFLPEFMARHSDRLGISSLQRARTALLPVAIAARTLECHWRAGRAGDALKLAAKLPPAWWPLLPPLAIRARRKETARLGEIARHVPAEYLYPA